MQQLYKPDNITPAYQLNWGLTIFWREQPIPDREWLTELQAATEPDGVRVLKHRFTSDNASQFFVSTKPHVSPSEMIRSIKGRLQHLIRSQEPKAFQRNYAVRSIGAATRSVVEDYVAKQTDHHPMADPRVQELLKQYQKSFPEVDLSLRVLSAHGMYWYGLHLVLVNEARWMEIRADLLNSLSSMIERVAAKYECRLSHVTVFCVAARSTITQRMCVRPTATRTSRITVTTTTVSVLRVPCRAGIRRVTPAESAWVSSPSLSRVRLPLRRKQ